MIFLYNNNAISQLASPINNSVTTLTVSGGAGTKFPSPAAGQIFALTLNDAATGNIYEIVYVTSRTGDTMTVVRGQEGTAAVSWLAGDTASNELTAGTMRAIPQIGGSFYGVDVGAVNSLAIVTIPPITGYTKGIQLQILASFTNTGATTVNGGGGLVSLFRNDGSVMRPGDIQAGDIYEMIAVQDGGPFWLEFPTRSQLQYEYAVDTGSINTVLTAFVPPFTSLGVLVGVPLWIKKSGSPNDGPATITVDGLAATPIINVDQSPLARGALPAGGVLNVIYDGANFQLIGGGVSTTILADPVNILSGAQINFGQTLLLGPDRLGYPARVTDYAAVSASNGATVPQGATASVASDWAGPNRIPIPIGSDGFFYQPVGVAGPVVYLRDQDGVQQGAAVQLANSTCDNLHMKPLSNGNFVVVWGDGTNIRFAIVTPKLGIVTAATTIETIYVGAQQYLDLERLSGGGFAVCYQQGTSNVLQRLAIYTNTGAVTLAPTTIQTWVGTAGACNCRLIQLSSGNIAIAMVSGFSTSTGVYYAIYTAAGASVLASTRIIATCRAPAWIEVSQLAGFFAISVNDGTTPFVQWAWVYNNAGVLQGSAFNGTTANINSLLPNWVMKNDGVSFYLIWHDAASWYMTTIPTAGAGYATRNLSTSVSGFLGASTNTFVDMFITRGVVVPVFPATNQFISFRLSDLFVLQGLTAVGSPTSPDGFWQSIVDAGDFSYLSCWAQGGSPYTQAFYGAKFANSVILGSAGQDVAANALCSIYVSPGAYAQSPEINGSPSVHFDHTAITAPGRGIKGVILNGGLVSGGML